MLAVIIFAVVQTALLLVYTSLQPQVSVTITADETLDREIQTALLQLGERKSRSIPVNKERNGASNLTESTENQYGVLHNPNGELEKVETSKKVGSTASPQTSQTTAIVIDSETKSRQRNGRGYFIGSHSCDQLTGGAMNFLSWQCLSSYISPDVYTVEPFVVESTLGAYFFDITDRDSWYMENNVSISDIYDINQWNSYVHSKGIRSLVPWQEFIAHAPREVIYVETKQGYRSKCKMDIVGSGFFKIFDFHVVRNVCVQQSSLTSGGNQLPTIYGQYSPSNVTVLFRHYLPTLNVEGTPCVKGTFWGWVSGTLNPSKRILRDADTYIQKYLGSADSYISIMVRIEHAVVSQSSPGGKMSVVKKSLENVLEKWKEFKSSFKLNKTFITLDTGRFGSNILLDHEPIWNITHPLIVDFMHSIYGDTLSFEEWENSFIEVSGLSTGASAAGYIAILQKAIASRGRCLIQAGGGTFQNSARSLYNQAHLRVRHCIT